MGMNFTKVRNILAKWAMNEKLSKLIAKTESGTELERLLDVIEAVKDGGTITAVEPPAVETPNKKVQDYSVFLLSVNNDRMFEVAGAIQSYTNQEDLKSWSSCIDLVRSLSLNDNERLVLKGVEYPDACKMKQAIDEAGGRCYTLGRVT